MKGVLFAGAEIGALYFYKQNSDAAVQYQSQLNAVLAQRDVDQAPGVDAAYDQETADKAAAGKATIDKANQNATLSLAVFGGAWALGVVDAFVFAPTPKAKKSMKRARLSLKLEQDYHQSQKPTLALLSPLSTDVSEDAIWYAGYAIPVAPQDRGAVKVGVAWEL